MFQQFGEVRLDDMLEQLLQFAVLAGVVEELEVAETHVARRQAQQHGATLGAFAVDQGVRTGDAQRAGTGNAEGVQMLAGEEFADRRAQHRATIAHARIGRLAGALEVQVPVLAGLVHHLAEQQASAVAELRVVTAELVAGIDHRARLGGGPDLVPGEQFGEQRLLGFGRVEIQQGHRRLACHHQARRFQRLRRYLGGKGIAETGEAIVEMELGQGLQVASGAACGQAWPGRSRACSGRWRTTDAWTFLRRDRRLPACRHRPVW